MAASVCMTTDIEGHGHILLPIADYVSVHVRAKIKSL